jgi:hypothetical protein
MRRRPLLNRASRLYSALCTVSYRVGTLSGRSCDTGDVFPFAHLDAAKKKDAVNVRVANNAKLATVRSRILTEIGRSRFLCVVCHQKETRQGNTVR